MKKLFLFTLLLFLGTVVKAQIKFTSSDLIKKGAEYTVYFLSNILTKFGILKLKAQFIFNRRQRGQSYHDYIFFILYGVVFI